MKALLRGDVRVSPRTVIMAGSLLTERIHQIELQDFQVVAELPETTWIDIAESIGRPPISSRRIRDLASMGLLVTDLEDPTLARLAKKDSDLRSVPWNEYGRTCHVLTKWSKPLLGNFRQSARTWNQPDSFEEQTREFGPPPPPWPEVPNVLNTIELPITSPRDPLFNILTERQTTRSYERSALPKKTLATVMYYTFGCHGIKEMPGMLTLTKKTSPSGGALHPIEVYPLVVSVAGVESGVYHYNTSEHSIELLCGHSREAAREIALELTAGQTGFAGAQVIFILIARFERHFWKYRNHYKGYKVLCLEAGHLSQTLYLVSTQLGLGAFVTCAIDDDLAETLAGVDGVREGVIGICGCGIPVENDPERFTYSPFIPRNTDETD